MVEKQTKNKQKHYLCNTLIRKLYIWQ